MLRSVKKLFRASDRLQLAEEREAKTASEVDVVDKKLRQLEQALSHVAAVQVANRDSDAKTDEWLKQFLVRSCRLACFLCCSLQLLL